MKKNYKWNIIPPADEKVISHLQESLNVSSTIANLLANRGISSFEEAKSFFRPNKDMLHSPFLMKDMEKASDRLLKAVENNERILIYGDYDVDGTTAVSMVYNYMIEVYENIDYYIPDRYQEGYGISFQAIDYANDNEITLVIALDCGIKAVDKIEYANNLQIDFIICDHHRPGDVLPQAVAILDPKQKDCNYPYKELSGCGVGFKLMQAVNEKLDKDWNNLYILLDLVATSIACDIVPLTGENRVLTALGLDLIQNNKGRFGINALTNVAKVGNKIKSRDLVFKIGPRINAAGRISSANKAVMLLTSKNEEEATKIALDIHENNRDRQNIDKKTTLEALEQIELNPLKDKIKTTVLYNENWHKGVIGIVASRLIEHYYRPTIILTQSNGKLTGSARSIKGFDIYHALEACNDLLEQFGGHKYAAGLTMQDNNLELFKDRFEEVVSKTIDSNLLYEELKIDAELNLNELKDSDNYPKFYRILNQFEPFGPQNMTPKFITKGVEAEDVKLLKEEHLKFSFYEENSSIRLTAIGFNMAHFFEIVNDKKFDIVYSLSLNEWNGRREIQAEIRDIRPSDFTENLIQA